MIIPNCGQTKKKESHQAHLYMVGATLVVALAGGCPWLVVALAGGRPGWWSPWRITIWKEKEIVP